MQTLPKHIASCILESNYFVGAVGCRNLSFDELVKLITIIRSHKNFLEKLNLLHRYTPETIELDRSFQETNCPEYQPGCNCFLPDVGEGAYRCVIERQNKIKDSRKTIEYENWRCSVFERDNFTCQECGQHGGDLNAHHIKSYKDHEGLRLAIENGRTLCEKCHREIHREEN